MEGSSAALASSHSRSPKFLRCRRAVHWERALCTHGWCRAAWATAAVMCSRQLCSSGGVCQERWSRDLCGPEDVHWQCGRGWAPHGRRCSHPAMGTSRQKPSCRPGCSPEINGGSYLWRHVCNGPMNFTEARCRGGGGVGRHCC